MTQTVWVSSSLYTLFIRLLELEKWVSHCQSSRSVSNAMYYIYFLNVLYGAFLSAHYLPNEKTEDTDVSGKDLSNIFEHADYLYSHFLCCLHFFGCEDGQFPKAQLAPGHPHWRQSATPKLKPTMQRDTGGNPLVRHRQNRKCGECEACLLKTDCGRCDFCCDKPKFGGQNIKQQKCRWRQCLKFAMDPDTTLPVVNLLIATSPKNKQEYAEPDGNYQASSDSLVSARFPQFTKLSGTPSTEVVVIDDPEDNEMELLQQIQPPVIMEVYSLGGVQPLSQLDSVLREFLAELNEIPLPAHWEVLPPFGSPNLRLIQRSKHSTMSAAVIHIRPGLFFHVVVQDLLVPQEHELYASHPARLTTVDEVVELICNLEAYQLCSGWPAGWNARERSETCVILVHSGCCPQCQLIPWPSGSGTH